MVKQTRSQTRRLSSGLPMAALVLLLSFLVMLISCGGQLTPESTQDAVAPTPDVSVLDADASSDAQALDSEFVDTAEVGYDADASEDASLPCTQGDKCVELGKPCGLLVCTPCGWQLNMSDCDEAGSDADADTSDTADSTDTTVGDTTPDTDAGAKDSAPDGETGSPDSLIADSTADSGDTFKPTDATSEAEVTAPKKFTCTGWTRDKKFDEFKLGGVDAKLVGGIWGTSTSNIYVSVATYSTGAAAHWNGMNWLKEDLDSTSPPSMVGNVWGTSDDNVWIPGSAVSAGVLYKRSEGVWSKDTSVPYSKGFTKVWSDGSSVMYIIGGIIGESMVWRKAGSSAWEKIIFPSPSVTDYRNLRNVWGLDTSHVFVTGYYSDTSGNATKGILYYWNGTSWTDVKLPTDCIELGGIHGTSLDDLWVTCLKDTTTGVIYQVTSKLAIWTTKVTKTVGYGPVWSKHASTALALGYEPPAFAGSLRFTTIDVSSSTTSSVDSKAYNPVAIWPEPGSNNVHFGHIATSGTIAGFYTGTCDLTPP